jgi:hypothetical protein
MGCKGTDEVLNLGRMDTRATIGVIWLSITIQSENNKEAFQRPRPEGSIHKTCKR